MTDKLNRNVQVVLKHLLTNIRNFESPKDLCVPFFGSLSNQFSDDADTLYCFLLECSCDLRGTLLDSECDPMSGQCSCVTGVTGRQCNECARGRFGFPKCDLCECHERSEECDPDTGLCLDCGQHSTGDHCERSVDFLFLDFPLIQELADQKC